MTQLSETQQRLAEALFTIGAIKFGEFKLKLHESKPDAPLSPIFLNLRTPVNPKPGPLTPEVVDMVAQEFLWIVCANDLQNSVRYVCGIPNAGDPFADALARKMHNFPVKLMTLQKAETPKGRRVSQIRELNDFTFGDRVLLVDDLITQADSKFEAVEVIEGAGLKVQDILVLVDREQGGREQLEAKGYRLHAVFTLTQLLDFYVSREHICPRMRDKVLAYVAANR